MIYYLLANCFSALSNVLNKYFITNDYFPTGTKMLDVTFHANIINFILFTIFFIIYKRKTNMEFSIVKSVFNKRELLQIILFSIPIYAAAFKISMLQNMPIPYVEVSSMIKPFLVWILALMLLHEKFYSYYLIYVFFAIIGFAIANYENLTSNYVSHDGDIKLICKYLLIGSIGDITRRYYCRKWDNTVQAIFIEMLIFGLYGFLYLFKYDRFSLQLFFSPYTTCYAMLALLHHTCIIHGVKRAVTVASLEILNFSKNIFSFLFSAILLPSDEALSKMQVVGALIIGISLYLFNIKRKSVDKKNANDVGNNV